MQWGALRAQASRPPQQPPGLAGSCMLRPPRAPLAVPRCPHRPHGGRLSKPEALQQGSGGGGVKRWGGRVSPRGSGLGGGAGCSLQCLQLLYAHRGLDPGVRTGGPCLRLPRPVPQTLWLIMESSAPERRGEPEPQFGHPREANWAPPPSPPTTSPAPAAGSCASRSC